MSWTQSTQGDVTTFEMVGTEPEEMLAVVWRKFHAGADQDKTVFHTYMGKFTLREILAYLYTPRN